MPGSEIYNPTALVNVIAWFVEPLGTCPMSMLLLTSTTGIDHAALRAPCILVGRHQEESVGSIHEIYTYRLTIITYHRDGYYSGHFFFLLRIAPDH
jgi:hypothetical protein